MRLTLLTCICAYLLSLSNLSAQIGEPKSPAISLEVISDMVKSIPSPLEISFLIKDLEIPYNKNLLTPTASPTTEFRQALHLGIYSADLGYANIYEQTNDALACLQNVKNNVYKLGIGASFDFNTIQKFTSTRGNLDTLLLVTDANLARINDRLMEKDRSDLTVLILTGGWVESLHITCAIYQKNPNKLLANRIGEQKIILEQLLLLLSFYEQQDKEIENLIKELSNLNQMYKNVKITYTNEEPSTKEGINREKVIEGGPETEIKIEGEDFKAIHQSINNIHQYIHQGKSTNSRVKTYIYKEKKKKEAKTIENLNTNITYIKKKSIKYLYGTWELVEVDGRPDKGKYITTITFLKDKTFIQAAGKKQRGGTWDIATNKKQMILNPEGKKSEIINVTTLTQDTFIFHDDRNTITLKKVKP